MKLSELKSALNQVNEIEIYLPNGEQIPAHFHLTELGLSTKHFIDCGGKIHTNKAANLQLWVANDVDHILSPSGLIKIIDLSNKVLENQDLEIEVEYQLETIGKFGLEFKNKQFHLTSKSTDCLAKVQCGITYVKQKASSLASSLDCCTPESGCC